MPPGAKLRIKVGLINGASAGNVEFYIGKFGDVATISAGVAYADGVKVVEARSQCLRRSNHRFCIRHQCQW